MSEFHFVRVFRELAGLPPLRFLSALRLAQARDLLVSTDEAVIQICLKVGYSSVGTFTRRFTELVGIPPLRLRQYARATHAPAAGGRALLLGGADVRVYVTSAPEVEPELASRALIAAFGSPLPFGPPAACALAREGDSIFPSRLGLGRYYFLAFGMVGQMRTCASPVLVAIHDLAMPHEARITLRRAEPTDPPLLSFVPFILYKKCLEG
jgi:AraC family transcriptional regulator